MCAALCVPGAQAKEQAAAKAFPLPVVREFLQCEWDPLLQMARSAEAEEEEEEEPVCFRPLVNMMVFVMKTILYMNIHGLHMHMLYSLGPTIHPQWTESEITHEITHALRMP